MENQTELQRELMAVLEPAQKEIKGALEEIREVRKELLSHQERETPFDDSKVRDLEAKLADLEKASEDTNERVRLATMAITTPSAPETRDAFAGVFIRDAIELQKAAAAGNLERAITSGTTLASYGKLNPEQEQQFRDFLIGKTVALSRVQTLTMSAPQRYLDELLTASRKLRAAAEAQAPTAADAFTTARRTLTTVETIWAEDVSLMFIEDNIEGGAIDSHIARNLATAVGNDHNDLFWNGDEDDSDDFLGINDGIIDIAKADGSVVDYDAASDTTVEAILSGAYRVFAYDYAARPDLNPTVFVPYKTALTYAEAFANHSTAFGEQVTLNGLPALRYFGVPVVAEPHLGGDEAVLTPAQNLIWGVQRGITMESQWNQRKRVIEYTITARTDQNYAKSQAVVLIDGIQAGLR